MASKGFTKSSKLRTNSPTYLLLQFIQLIQVAARSNCPDMTIVFHAKLCVKSLIAEIKTGFLEVPVAIGRM